jgi:hypothetical protein
LNLSGGNGSRGDVAPNRRTTCARLVHISLLNTNDSSRGGYWVFSARKWFTGPRMQGDETRIAAIEAEFDHIESELKEID